MLAKNNPGLEKTGVNDNIERALGLTFYHSLRSDFMGLTIAARID